MCRPAATSAKVTVPSGSPLRSELVMSLALLIPPQNQNLVSQYWDGRGWPFRFTPAFPLATQWPSAVQNSNCILILRYFGSSLSSSLGQVMRELKRTGTTTITRQSTGHFDSHTQSRQLVTEHCRSATQWPSAVQHSNCILFCNNTVVL